MNRRTALKVGGMAAIGFGMSACTPQKRPDLAPLRPLVPLAPVNASWDRIIRTTVGLRPHRDAGFVLRAEKLAAKTLIHNYGHGGAGMSISWGTGVMAAEHALETGTRRAAVIGCGAVGLTAARQLQRRGIDVTIYAMAIPPETTSNMSLAGFTPTSGLVEPGRRTPEWDAQFMRAARISYEQLQLLVGSGYGVSWVFQYGLTDEPPQPQASQDTSRPNLQAGLGTGRELLHPGEHPFPTKYATRRPTLRIEPSVFLDALMRDVLLFGGRIVIRRFDAPRDLMTLDEPVIVNCTGLGSRTLFGDEELVPVKGQLSVLVPQPEVDYSTSGGPSGAPPGAFIHMMPRTDGIILGGTSERGVATLEPNEEERKRVVGAHIQVFSSMRQAPPRAGSNPRSAASLGELPRGLPALESHFGYEY
jgi:D-amino-acid oxidase